MYFKQKFNAHRILILGRANQGKTTLLVNLLVRGGLIENSERCFICSTTYRADDKWRFVDPYLRPGKDMIFLSFTEELVESIRDFSGTVNNNAKEWIFVFDDIGRLLRSDTKAEKIINTFISIARHKKCTVLFSAQSLVQTPMELRQNFDLLVLYKTINVNELKKIWLLCGSTFSYKVFATQWPARAGMFLK